MAEMLKLCSLCLSRFCNHPTSTVENVRLATGQDVCTACLGNDDFWSLFLPSRLADDFKRSNHDKGVKTYRLSITLPICHALRQRLVWETLDPRSRKPYTSVTDLKHTVKSKISHALSERSGLTEQKNSPFSIAVALASSLSPLIIELLADPALRPHIPSKYRQKGNPLKLLSNSRAAVDEMASSLPVDALRVFTRTALEISSDNLCRLERIGYSHESVFIAGRYIKNSRTMSQSPWSVKGSDAETSVSGYLERLLVYEFDSAGAKFSSAGREDKDVRMLGCGRPFLLEITNPKRFPSVCPDKWADRLFSDSNGALEVKGLALVDGKLAAAALKEGEETKSKIYRCVVGSSKKLAADHLKVLDRMENFTIVQRTPIRVLQRRANLKREKRLYRLAVQYINERTFLLYIKEFVHGDFNRTLPSLGNILFDINDALELTELDVLHVDLPDWPPLGAILH